MHTKFRPIITENARKHNSTGSDSTETVSTKVVKPIAISAWSKHGKAVPALHIHETDNNSFPLLNPVPVVDGSSFSFDDQDSASFGKEHASMYSPTSAREKPNRADAFKSTKRGTSLEKHVPLKDLDLLQFNAEVGDGSNSENEHLEEGRPASGNSQQLDMSSARCENIEKEADLTSISNTSSHPPKNESTLPGCLITNRAIEERIAYAVKFERSSGTDFHPHMKDGLGESLPTSSLTTENEIKKASDSSESAKIKKSAAHEAPRFSDVLESEDSSHSDQQEFDHRNAGVQDSLLPISSRSSSNGGSFEKGEACSSPKMRKTSSGNRLSLRRFERKHISNAGSGESKQNPWFHNTSSSKDEDDDSDHVSIENETWRPEKGNKKKTSRFSRLFRSAKSIETDPLDDALVSPSGGLSLRVSGSEDSSGPIEEVNPKQDVLEEHLEETLALAISGKRNLEEVIDALLGISGRPGDKVMKLLTKYMCSTVVIDEVFKVILEHEHAKKADIPMRSMAPSHARYSPHREALVNLFANGPERLKKALLHHNKARSEILRFFTDERPDGDVEIPHWLSTATSLSKILNGLLAQFPAELSEYIGGKKGVLHLMVKNHVHVPEVVEFVIQLSAANALSKTTGDDLRYGAANATGLVLLVKEGVCDLLVDIFRKSSNATAQCNTHLLEWQTQVMSTQCLLELSKRAIVIPRFTKDNCSYSNRYIKTLNSSLDELSLFTQDARILSLLNAGFEAVSDGPEIENVREQSERNNPLVCALAVIIELLETVRVAAGSKLAVTRRTVGSTNTAKVEKHLVSKMARLCKLLHRKSAHEVSSRAKVAIVNVFRCLCTSNVETTRLSMVKSQIPDRLMILIRENPRSSVLHSCVLKCLSASFSSPQSIELHREWLRALARTDGWLQVMYEYFQKVKGGDTHGCKPFFNTFVEIGFCLMEFCQEDKETKLRPMLKTKTEVQTFVDSIEAGLLSMQKEYETPCGGPKPTERAVSVLANAETLAARLHDFNAV